MQIGPSKQYLYRKRNELIWQLSLEGYSGGDIAEIMKLERSWVNRTIKKMPSGWRPKTEKSAQ